MQLSPFNLWGRQFIDGLPLQVTSQVLDVGCRNGSVSNYLANRHPHLYVTAMESKLNKAALEQHGEITNLQFLSRDIENFHEVNGYDAVLSFNHLLWVENKQRALNNIYQALKPGKKVYLLLFALHGRPKNDRFFYQIAQKDTWRGYFHNFKPDYYETTLHEFGALLQSVGFLINRLCFNSYETQFENGEVLQSFFQTWGSHHKRIPIQKRKSFVAETTSAYLDFYQKKYHEPFTYKEIFLEVECERPLQPMNHEATRYYQFQHIRFTSYEAQVIKYYLQGKTAKEISVYTKTTSKTVEFHLAKIKEKLGISLRSQLFKKASELGFISLVYDRNL